VIKGYVTSDDLTKERISGSSKSQDKAKISGGASGIHGQLILEFIRKHYSEKFKDTPHDIFSEVVSFGVLNAEGSSNKLHEQTMYFVHLTFKEYLTAFQMYEWLKNENKKGDEVSHKLAAEAIAENRNNPSYLMTLKFLAGIVSDDKSDNRAMERFWEAVTCNLDGIIELGVDAKVELLMHLLSQSREKGKLDSRIPNLDSIVKFIDFIIVGQGLHHWQDKILESGYLSQKIVDKIFKLMHSNHSDLIVEFSPRKEKEMATKTTTFKSATKQAEIKASFEIAQKLNNDQLIIDKIGVDGKIIFHCLVQLLCNDKIDWQLKRFVIKKLGDLAINYMGDKKFKEASSKIAEIIMKRDENLKDAAIRFYIQMSKHKKDMVTSFFI